MEFELQRYDEELNAWLTLDEFPSYKQASDSWLAHTETYRKRIILVITEL